MTCNDEVVDHRNEYLHEGGWQNVDNPLHEQEFVQNEMHSFHLDHAGAFGTSTMYNL